MSTLRITRMLLPFLSPWLLIQPAWAQEKIEGVVLHGEAGVGVTGRLLNFFRRGVTHNFRTVTDCYTRTCVTVFTSGI